MDTESRQGLTGVIAQIEELSITATVALAVLLGGFVVWFDVLTGPDISCSIFYVAPVAVIAGRLGRHPGKAAAVLAAVAWYATDLHDHSYAQPLIPIWNGLVRLGFFLIIAIMTVALRRLVGEQAAQARVDPLTELLNRRGFMERGAVEVALAGRHNRPLTMAYLDLDGFKRVNDTAGHAAGDTALREIAAVARSALRVADVVARLGGDEFAFLLPDTSAHDAHVVVDRLHRDLLDHGDARIGFSLGVVTFSTAPADISSAIDLADRLMYRAKIERPGGVHYQTM